MDSLKADPYYLLSMRKLSKARTYALTTGLIMFVFGIVKFAFRGSAHVPDYVLIFAIIFGFWGILAAFTQSGNK
jgi:hypothetical protein